jgi:hypothetical protein
MNGIRWMGLYHTFHKVPVGNQENIVTDTFQPKIFGSKIENQVLFIKSRLGT